MTNDSTAWQQRIIDNAAKKEAEDAIAYRCRDALSALGDPVVVAEALPELVEAVEHIIGALTEDDFEASGFFRSDLARPVADAEILLAKLKAQP